MAGRSVKTRIEYVSNEIAGSIWHFACSDENVLITEATDAELATGYYNWSSFTDICLPVSNFPIARKIRDVLEQWGDRIACGKRRIIDPPSYRQFGVVPAHDDFVLRTVTVVALVGEISRVQ